MVSEWVGERRQEGVDSLMCTLPVQMRVCGCDLVLVRFDVLLITTPLHHSTNDQDHKPALQQTTSSHCLSLVCGLYRQTGLSKARLVCEVYMR